MSTRDRRVAVTMLVSEDDFVRTWEFARKHALTAVCRNEEEIADAWPPASKKVAIAAQKRGREEAAQRRRERGYSW